MNQQETALQLIAELSGVERATLSSEMELVAELGLDSPKAFQLIVELEERLGIEIGDEDAAAMHTVGDILDYIGRRV